MPDDSLSTTAGTFVSLLDVKDYLSINDTAHDGKLLGFIEDVTPLIEDVTGPVIVRTHEEWHDGGQCWVTLRRKPSYVLGTTPVFNIVGCDEYRGPIKYTLSVIADPTQATIYSCQLDARTGTLYRRTTGGGIIPFGAGPFGGGMPQAVHVVYQSGQSTIPGNVRRATLEAIRVFYEGTQPTGTGTRTLVDQSYPASYTAGRDPLPPEAMKWLGPMRRRPAIA